MTRHCVLSTLYLRLVCVCTPINYVQCWLGVVCLWYDITPIDQTHGSHLNYDIESDRMRNKKEMEKENGKKQRNGRTLTEMMSHGLRYSVSYTRFDAPTMDLVVFIKVTHELLWSQHHPNYPSLTHVAFDRI